MSQKKIIVILIIWLFIIVGMGYIAKDYIGNKYGVNFDLNAKTYDAVGCKHCNNTGYYDRIGIFEVLNITDEIKTKIVEGKSSIEIKDEALKQGYKPLVVDGINKVVKGFTTLEELNKKLLIF